MAPSLGGTGGSRGHADAFPAAGLPAHNPPTLRSVRDGGSMVSSPTVKYRQMRQDTEDPNQATGKKNPSHTVQALINPSRPMDGWRPKPRIIEFLNIGDYTHQTESAVELGETIFQPFPPQVDFFGYEPYKKYEAMIYFRNNDKFGRRVKVLPLNSPFFSVTAVPKKADMEARAKGGKEKTVSGKVAPGMEVQYKVTFTPRTTEDYAVDLVAVTEREKFIVPIRATGVRGALDFPDEVMFECTMVKDTASKTFMVRNVGTKATGFELSTSKPFSISPSAGHLAVGEVLQCTVNFTPQVDGLSRGELLIRYEDGDVVMSDLAGTAEETHVGLSHESIQCKATFISITNQQSFKVINHGSQVVKFAFKKFAKAQDDDEVLLHQSLDLADHTALAANDAGVDLRMDPEEDEELDDDSEDEDYILRGSRLTMTRDYRSKQQAIQMDQLMFEHEAFTLSPAEGVIWPGSAVDVIVTFHPKGPVRYEVLTFCEIFGRVDRIPLALLGDGLGPKAVFSYECLDIGNVFINSVNEYKVELYNRGEIEADYTLSSGNGPMSNKWSFSPASGTLKFQDVHTITMTFSSDVLGDFSETFTCNIKGGAAPLTLDFNGKVVGPTYKLNVKNLDFGVVSFKYKYTKTMEITNTSEIPMTYHLRVPLDTAGEFVLTPESATVLPGQTQEVTVEFTSQTVQKYDCRLTMDVDMVGTDLMDLPILAECCVPRVAMLQDTLDYGETFLRYDYKLTLTLKNESKLPAKFEVVPQDDGSRGLAVYTPSPAYGDIPARASQEIEFTLSTERNGRINLPVFIRILGSRDPPLECIIAAMSKGPSLVFGKEPSKPLPNWKPELKFGDSLVLNTFEKKLYVTNKSLIPAEIKTFVTGQNSPFWVDVREATILPEEEICLTTNLFLDSINRFRDTLNIMVMESKDIAVALEANGIGSTVVCTDRGLEECAFGTQYMSKNFEQELVLMNMGRDPQTIQWLNPLEADRKARAAKAKASGKGDPDKILAEEIVFSVEPDKAVIKPNESTTFVIRGYGTKAGNWDEHVQAKVFSGKDNELVFDAHCTATIIKPNVELSTKAMSFLYSFEPGVPCELQTAPLTLRNVSELPMAVSLKATAPWSVDVTDHYLQPEEAADVSVVFNPNYKNNQLSTTCKTKLLVNYMGTPYKDTVDLSGEINFPNLSLSNEKLNFGSVLNDTTKRMNMKITNVSHVDIVYDWSFLEDEEGAVVTEKKKKGDTTLPVMLRSSQVFDVLPIRGVLKPGESENVEFSFYAHANNKLNTTALCNVEGGPRYEVKLVSEASTIKYTLDNTTINFGQVLYQKVMEHTMLLENTGRVPFSYNVSLAPLVRKQVLEIWPLDGKLGPGEKVRFRMKVLPGIPDKIHEKFHLQVAHFEPEEISIVGEGIYPVVMFNIPHVFDLENQYEGYVDRARSMLVARGRTTGGPVPLSAYPRTARTALTTAASVSQSQLLHTETMRTADTLGSAMTSRDESPPRVPPSTAGTLAPEPDLGSTLGSALGRSTKRALVTGGGYEPPMSEIEAEADRLQLCGLLLRKEEEKAEKLREAEQGELARTMTTDDGMTKKFTLEERLTMDLTKAPSPPKPPAKGKRDKEMPPQVIARYYCDFGFVIKGSHKVKKLKLQNVSTQQVSFVFDKKQIPPGFSVDPESVGKLPGAPDYETLEMAVTLHTGSIPVGKINKVVPIQIKQGPIVELHLVANVQMPEIEVSTTALDFGRVQVGRCKMMTVRLHNRKDVAADWVVRKPMEKVRDWAFFSCMPAAGTLQPGEKLNMQIVFEPTAVRDEWAQAIPIKVQQNKRDVRIQCVAESYNLKLRIDQPYLDLGAILPASEDGEIAPKEAFFSLCNDTEVPIEVFSVDFDAKYKEDDEVLEYAEGYNENNRMLLPPREVGTGLWPELVEANDARKEAIRQAEEAERLAAEGGEPEPEPEPAAEEPAADGEVGELDAVEEDALPVVAPDDTTNVLCLGPPIAGKTTQAAAMAERYGAKLFALDDYITELLEAERPWGYPVEPGPPKREPWGKIIPDDPAVLEANYEMHLRVAALAEKVKHKRAGGMTPEEEEEAAAKAEPEPEPAAAPPPAKGKTPPPAKGTPPPKEEPAPPAELAEGEEPPPTPLPVKLLAEVIALRMELEDCKLGVVFDGLVSVYAASEPDVYEAILIALGMTEVDAVMPEGAEPEEAEPPAKGKKGEPEAEEVQLPKVWSGPKRLVVMKMPLSQEEMHEREKALRKAAAEAAAAAAAEEEAAVAAAEREARRAERVAQGLDPDTPREDTPAADILVVDGEGGEGDGEAAAEPAPAAEPEPEPAAEAEEEPEFESAYNEAFEKYEEWSPKVFERFLSQEATNNNVVVRELPATATAEEVTAAAATSVVAKPVGWEDVIPESEMFHILKKPMPRLKSKAITKFTLFTVNPEEEKDEAEAPPPDPKAKGGKGAAEPEPAPEPYTQESRWIIPPHSEVPLMVRFRSEQIGKFQDLLAFQVVGTELEEKAVVKGECAYPSISTDYRNVFYRKAKTRPSSPRVSRQYIISKKVFEFGPLLRGLAEPAIMEGTYPTYVEKFRITNNGLFDNKVTFSFRGGAQYDEGGAMLETFTPTIFRTVPAELELAIDETQDVQVFAVPTEEGPVDDVLICTIKDNPNTEHFAVRATGVTPVVELDKERIEFTRLLCDHSDTLTFTVRNKSLLPVKWSLAGLEALPSEFTFSQTSGTLDARSEFTVAVTFTGVEKAVYDTKMTLEIRDAQELLAAVVQAVQIPLSAEAYKIEVDMKFPSETSELDFGLVKVLEDNMKQMSICNTGKYQVGYKFRIKTAAMREMFTITPQEGTIEPGKEQAVEVHFNKEKTLTREVMLKGDTSISLMIIEVLTGKKETTTPIKVNLRSAFTKYTMTPAQGLNFGPLLYNTTSNPRVVEIANTGEFPFNVKIRPYGDEEPEGEAAEAPPPDKKGGKGGKDDKKGGKDKGGGGGAEGPVLEQGNFTIQPCEASVEPGDTLKVSITFLVQNCRTYCELLGINITDRDPNDHPGGIPYEIAGESCIPGIVTEDFMSMFEEHKLVSSLDPLTVENNLFAMRDRIFTFGAVIAHMGPEDELTRQKKAVAAAGEAPKPGLLPGAQANFKITNPNKIPCTVNLALKPRTAAKAVPEAKGAKAVADLPADEAFPMDIQPQQVVIAPHEYRYVTCYFNPQRIQAYSATLELDVDNGSDPKTKHFNCEVRGEGTLPHVTVEVPETLNEEGHPLLTFPRLLLGKSHTLPVTLRNNGIIPAVARLEMGPSDVFSLASGLSSNFTLESKRTTTFQVTYTPKRTQEVTHKLTLMVKHNQFETQHLEMRGDCYMEDVTFEGLPRELDDELHFEDGAVGTPKEVGFTLRNHTGKHFRVRWPKVSEHFTFLPRRAHLHAHATKDVLVRFHPGEPVQCSPLEDMALVLEEITYADEEGNAVAPADWDDRMTAVKYVPLDYEEEPEPEDEPRPSAAAGGKGGKAPPPAAAKAPPPKAPPPKAPPAAAAAGGDGDVEGETKKITVVEPEPLHSIVEGSAKEVPLKIYAVADNARYECSVSSVAFRPTMMFQARSFSFTLKNTSTAKLEFAWSLHRPDGTPLVGAEAEQPLNPFTVSPLDGVIEADKSVQVTVRFAPAEVDEFPLLLNCTIPNLDAGYEPLSIPLRGKVQRPWCHFEMPESDYLSAGRRNPELPGPGGSMLPLDPNTRVLEFESLGTKVKNLKKFFILNPTNVPYEFVWEAEPGAPDDLPKVSSFRCLTRRGTIMGGKRYEILFEYTALTDEISESFWRFRIPEQDISVPFLLVGLVLEPNVTLDRAGLNFHNVLLGSRARDMVMLTNHEKQPFQFAFDKASYEASDEQLALTGKRPVVDLEPSSGIIQPGEQLAISVSFTPAAEKIHNYNVICAVRKKPTRLTLNVKGEGYAIHHSVQLENPIGRPLELSPSGVNALDFGEVLVSERATKQVYFLNMGSINYEFVWNTGDNPHVSVTPATAVVAKGERVVCELAYNPQNPEVLDYYKLQCNIINGAKYQFAMAAHGHRPKLNFSFYSYDFGPSFLYSTGMHKHQVILHVVNEDHKDISYDVQFENTEWLEVEAPPTVLAPGEGAQIPISFLPRETRTYEETLMFEVNGVTKMPVKVAGEGTKLRLELAAVASAHTVFGQLRVGQESTKAVKVVNRSVVPVKFTLEPCVALLRARGVNLLGPTEIYLRANESTLLNLQFRPPKRQRPFTEDVVIEMLGLQKTMLTVAGACLGVEAKLSTDNVSFGPVVKGSQLARHLVVSNTGDVGTKFTFDAARLAPHFTISPTEGFLSTNQDLRLDVTFHPKVLSEDLRAEQVRMNVEGGEPQFLTLAGMCVDAEQGATVVSFQTVVRGSVVQNVTVANSTEQAWALRPVINNEMWRGPDVLNVPAGGSAEYPLTYAPKTMATSESPHQGSVFFPYPTGSAKLFTLQGVATPPGSAGDLVETVPSKAQHTVLLNLTNWLNLAQRFKVDIEKPDDEATTLKGASNIDVPALSQREYKLGFYAYKEGETVVKVTFTNEATGEYLFYNITFKAGEPNVLSTIRLQGPVRGRIYRSLTITNPLARDVTLTPSCDHKQVFLPEEMVLKAKVDTEVTFSFRPVLVEDKTALLTLESADLGKYVYQLDLSSTPIQPERVLQFNVPLGSKDMLPFRFHHFLNDKAEYRCTFENKGASGFESEPSVVGHAAGPEGIELEVEVTFEPTKIGDSFRDTLVVQSPEGGEYLCPVIARCINPKPQGPIVIKAGKGQLQFKNVFTQPTDFKFVTDNPAFVVKPGENIPAKQARPIDVTYDASKSDLKTGKLIITCTQSTASPPWIYYLRVGD